MIPLLHFYRAKNDSSGSVREKISQWFFGRDPKFLRVIIENVPLARTNFFASRSFWYIFYTSLQNQITYGKPLVPQDVEMY